jgi:hypothetical protein
MVLNGIVKGTESVMPKWSILIENKIDNIKDFQEACFENGNLVIDISLIKGIIICDESEVK